MKLVIKVKLVRLSKSKILRKLDDISADEKEAISFAVDEITLWEESR